MQFFVVWNALFSKLLFKRQADVVRGPSGQPDLRKEPCRLATSTLGKDMTPTTKFMAFCGMQKLNVTRRPDQSIESGPPSASADLQR